MDDTLLMHAQDGTWYHDDLDDPPQNTLTLRSKLSHD